MASNKRGALLIFISACLWGIMGIYVRNLNANNINSMQVVCLRSILTVLILTPALFFYNKNLLKIKIKDIWCFLGTGIASVVCFTYFYFTTMTLASLSFAAVMMYTAPFMLVFISAILFKEKITVKKIIACIVAFAGCALVAGIFEGNTNVTTAGIFTGVASGFFYALYTVFSRYALDRGYNSITITEYTFVFASVGSLPFINIGQTAVAIFNKPSIILVVAIMAVFSTILPYLFYTLGLQSVENGVALIIATIEPVVATVIGIVMFNEKITLFAIIGIILVLSSVGILNINFKKRKARN